MQNGWRQTVQLGYSAQLNKEKEERLPAADHLALILTAALTGGSWMAFFCSAFHLAWSPAKVFSGDPLSGFLSLCNSIADRLGQTDYIILSKFAGGATEDGSPLPQGTCLTILLVFAVLLAYLVLRSRNRWLLLVFSVPPVLLVLLTHAAPAFWAGAVFAFGQMCAFAVMQRREGGGAVWLLLLTAIALVCSLAAAAAIDHGPGLASSSLQRHTAEAIEEALHHRYGEDPLMSGQLRKLPAKELKQERGSIDEVLQQLGSDTKDQTKTALVVSEAGDGEAMQHCYLRGFVGEVYASGSWRPLSPDLYYQQRNNLYWLNRQGFDGLSQMAESAAVSGNTAQPLQLSIHAEGADRSRIYTPYGLTGTDAELPEGMVNCAGVFLKPSGLFGSRDYTFYVQPEIAGEWTDWASRLYSAENTAEVRNYFASESHYNVWCYENDTYVPDEIAALLYGELGDPGDLSVDHADYKEAINTIREYLDRNFLYTDQFTAPEKGKDPMETFLETGKGCDVHFASLATLLLRHYGIPARYVQGYLVTPQDAEDLQLNKSIDIGFSHAHAWTEIYIDGFGWIPLEVSPDYRQIMPEADLEKGLESMAYDQKKNHDQSPQEETAESVSQEDYAKILRRLLATGGGILLLLILLWIVQRLIRRALRERRWKKAFADADPRKGICAMYAYMLAEEITVSERAGQLGDLAAYSNHEIVETDRSVMKQELERGKDEKKRMERQTRGGIIDRLSDAIHGLRGK